MKEAEARALAERLAGDWDPDVQALAEYVLGTANPPSERVELVLQADGVPPKPHDQD